METEESQNKFAAFVRANAVMMIALAIAIVFRAKAKNPNSPKTA